MDVGSYVCELGLIVNIKNTFCCMDAGGIRCVLWGSLRASKICSVAWSSRDVADNLCVIWGALRTSVIGYVACRIVCVWGILCDLWITGSSHENILTNFTSVKTFMDNIASVCGAISSIGSFYIGICSVAWRTVYVSWFFVWSIGKRSVICRSRKYISDMFCGRYEHGCRREMLV
jgi:hypothetical protein